MADITYVATWSGFAYAALVTDVFSRRIVGWSMAPHLRAELVIDALEMAHQRSVYRRHRRAIQRPANDHHPVLAQTVELDVDPPRTTASVRLCAPSLERMVLT